MKGGRSGVDECAMASGISLASCFVASRDKLFLARLSLVDVPPRPRLFPLLFWEGVFVPEQR